MGATRPTDPTRGLRPDRRVLVGALAGVLFAWGCSQGTVVAGAGSSGPRTDPAPDDPVGFGPLPDFELLSERGTVVTLASLRGRPLVVAALFTSCSGPCPRLARNLERLQEELRGTDVLLVAVSVDPETDTPDVLSRYARTHGAEPERWTFLTGEEKQVHQLVRQGFYLAVERAAPGAALQGVTHDTRLLAVDRAGQRRGWYSGIDDEGVERLRQRMLHLAAEKPRDP